MTSYLTSMDTISCISYRFRDIRLRSFHALTLSFDPWRSFEIKKIDTIRKPIYDFLFDFYGQHLSISYRFRDIRLQVFKVWPWPWTPESHLRSKKFIPSESYYMTSYLTSTDNNSLSRTFFEIFDFKLFRVWPWPLTPRNHLKSKKIIPFESWLPIWLLWTTSLYLVPFSRYSTSKFFRVRPWPFTPKCHLGSKKLYYSKAIYDFLFDFYGHRLSISYRSRDILLIVFRVWPWPLTPKKHPGSRNFILFESPYMTSYLTSMDNISLSRTVSEIFDFKIFRVWPWPLTPKSHLGSKKFIPFESSYMTSYLTSMDTISLSRTVFEIFDFKNFRVWPWPLTPEGHLGSKKVYHSKAHIWLPIWLLWTPSLYLVPFQRYFTQ